VPRCDLVLAEQVISDDEELDTAQARCEEHTFVLLSLQAPVARDLRLVVTAIQAAEKIKRMGDLARHRSALYSRPDGPATLRRGDQRVDHEIGLLQMPGDDPFVASVRRRSSLCS
jgi:hypothetical protein